MRKLLLSLSLFTVFQVYSQDGSLDATFGTGGKVVTTINGDESANAMIIQPDGKIVVAGYTYSNTYGNDIACLRYNTDGTLDDTFGTNGLATFDLQVGSDDKAMAIELQSDGKLIVAGYSDSGNNKEAAMLRLNADGTLDTSFGTEGIVLTGYSTNGVPNRQDEYWVVKVHGLTGKIVVGGTSYSTSNSSRAIVARYNPDGSLDSTFATEGKYTALPNSQMISDYLFIIEDIAIKPNGKITLVGWSSAWFYLARLNENGTMDTSFSSDGYSHVFGGQMYSVVLNNDDSFYFSGSIWTAPQTELYAGIMSASGNSITATPFFFGETMTAKSLAMQKDSNGKLVVAGYLQNNNTGAASFLVGRLRPDHSADPTFGNGGFVTTNFEHPISAAFDMKIQTDSKIVLAGLTGGKIALARYKMGGFLDREIAANNPTVTIYPNPASDFVNINLNEPVEMVAYQILDINGRVIKSGELLSSENKICVERFEAGVYFIKVGTTGSGYKFVKR